MFTRHRHGLALVRRVSPMPWGLKRYYGTGSLHFITWSCYRRKPLLGNPVRRDLVLTVLELPYDLPAIDGREDSVSIEVAIAEVADVCVSVGEGKRSMSV